MPSLPFPFLPPPSPSPSQHRSISTHKNAVFFWFYLMYWEILNVSFSFQIILNNFTQEEYNMTSPTSSLSGHEDSEVLSLLITDANSSMPSPLDNRLRHKMLEELTPQCVKKKAHKCRPSVRRNILRWVRMKSFFTNLWVCFYWRHLLH